MPTVLRDRAFGDSLCLDTASQGNAETYITKDVIAAVDDQLRTNVDPKQRGIGGLSMGGYCALNLGLKHPDLFSTVLDFSGDTEPVVDTLPGGLPDLFGPNYQPAVDANTPAKYLGTLNPARGPALWIDVGRQRRRRPEQISALVPAAQDEGLHRGVPHPPRRPRLRHVRQRAAGRAALGGRPLLLDVLTGIRRALERFSST